jgi:general secretion pathway protein C
MQSFKYGLIFLFSFTFAAFLCGVALLFLQKTPVFYVPLKKEYSFYSINLADLFFNSRVKRLSPIKIQPLKGVKLKAVYFNGKKGFVILEENKKTTFVDLGKSYKGYRLVEIGLNYAIFDKNNKKYKLQIENNIKNTFFTKTLYANNKVTVSKKVFREYLNNLNKIWSNIGIVKTTNGYMITYIRPKSIFEKIGLKRGDILLEINGRKLKNDADAWDLYKNANKFNSFEVKILRNKKEKVLYYEMD